MAHKKNNTNLTELLLQCMTQPDPMLSMLEWLCTRLMETEVDQQLGAEKSQRSDGRSGYRSGYRPSPVFYTHLTKPFHFRLTMLFKTSTPCAMLSALKNTKVIQT